MTDDMTTDELIDSLPPHLRRQVVGALEVQAIEAGEIPAPTESKPKISRRKLALALAWAFPMTILGLLMMATLVLLPVGILVLFLAAYPFAKVIIDYQKLA